MSKKKKHECNCGRKSGNQKRVVATCPDCTEALRADNGRKVPIHIVPVDVTLQQVIAWRNAGHVINIE